MRINSFLPLSFSTYLLILFYLGNRGLSLCSPGCPLSPRLSLLSSEILRTHHNPLAITNLDTQAGEMAQFKSGFRSEALSFIPKTHNGNTLTPKGYLGFDHPTCAHKQTLTGVPPRSTHTKKRKKKKKSQHLPAL